MLERELLQKINQAGIVKLKKEIVNNLSKSEIEIAMSTMKRENEEMKSEI